MAKKWTPYRKIPQAPHTPGRWIYKNTLERENPGNVLPLGPDDLREERRKEKTHKKGMIKKKEITSQPKSETDEKRQSDEKITASLRKPTYGKKGRPTNAERAAQAAHRLSPTQGAEAEKRGATSWVLKENNTTRKQSMKGSELPVPYPNQPPPGSPLPSKSVAASKEQFSNRLALLLQRGELLPPSMTDLYNIRLLPDDTKKEGKASETLLLYVREMGILGLNHKQMAGALGMTSSAFAYARKNDPRIDMCVEMGEGEGAYIVARANLETAVIRGANGQGARYLYLTHRGDWRPAKDNVDNGGSVVININGRDRGL